MEDLFYDHSNHHRRLDVTYEPFIFESYLISDVVYYRIIPSHFLDMSIAYVRNDLESHYAIDAPYGEEFRSSVQELWIMLGGK